MKEQSLARGLAVFSIGLGVAELVAPRKVAELIGVKEDHDILLRLMGAREIASGLGIMQGKSSHFLWSRVAGDMLDLGLLAFAARDDRNEQKRIQFVITVVATVTALDLLASILHSRDHSEPGWRVREPGRYEGAISQEDPRSLRENSDREMSQHQSGHVYRGDGDAEKGRRGPQPVPM
jgi:hypothetical protein